jgi:hypothetical protein
MNMPGFTAEASLKGQSRTYSTAPRLAALDGPVVPAWSSSCDNCVSDFGYCMVTDGAIPIIGPIICGVNLDNCLKRLLC